MLGCTTHTTTRRTRVRAHALNDEENFQEDQEEFNAQLDRLNHTLTEAAGSLQGGVELRKPDPAREGLYPPP